MNRAVKQLLIWGVVTACLVAVNVYLGRSHPKQLSVSYAEMLNKVQDGQVKDVTIDEATLVGHFADNRTFRATVPANGIPGMYVAFHDHGVNVTVKDQNSNSWVSVLVSILPFVLLLVLWFVILRLLQRSSRLKGAEPPAVK
jgi:cell division protease FtsH